MGQGFSLGTSDFRRIREQNLMYVDKTRIIELMENDSDFITFLRPRRFGKSLLVSTLFYYYDLKSADLFPTIFHDLYIGNHPTDEKNTYFVLQLNFSELEFANASEVPLLFTAMLIERLREFILYYAPLEKQKEFIEVLDPSQPVNTLLRRTLHNIAGFEGKVFLLIDEYDHFANRMIFSGMGNQYKSAVQGSGFIRQFFTTLKSLTSGTSDPIKRVFITGVLPILLNDITSGFNISKNVSKYESYQGMMGLTPSEVSHLLQDLGSYSKMVSARIEQLYNGFMFADSPTKNSPKVYNSQMVLSFINSYSQENKFPVDIIDSTSLSDKNKFDFLKTNPKNIEIILDILNSRTYASNYKHILDINDIFNSNYLTTLLFHFGLLTFHEYTPTAVIYRIPNLATKELYFEYFKDLLQEYGNGFEKIQEILQITKELSNYGKLNPLITFLQNDILSSFSFRDTIKLNEQSLKFLLMVFFKYTSFYEIRSEQELFASSDQGGYTDLALIESKQNSLSQIQSVNYEWLFEIKYLKINEVRSDLNKLGSKSSIDLLKSIPKIQKILKNAKKQLNQYKPTYEKTFQTNQSNIQMRYAVILFVGKEYVLYEIL